MMYSVSAFSFCVPQAIEVLAEVVWRPALKEEEVCVCVCVCVCERERERERFTFLV